MANPDDTATPAAAPAPPKPKGGIRALVRRIRRQPEPVPPTATEVAQNAAAVDLARQAVEFQTLRVADVMTPRADIVAVEVDTPFEELVARFKEAEHSRMPIYRETLDDPVGVVHVKDIFRMLADGAARPGPEAIVLRKVRRKALYVPASMRAADLLPKMQAGRIHMALVIDEFGGCDGLVTLEDLIEAVVGDIADEHDEAATSGVVARAEDMFEADARTDMDDVTQALGHDLVPPDLEEEIDTLAGLVTALAGRVPQRGEVIAHPDGHEFEVMDADPRRVKRVRIRLARATPAETAEAAG
ncbi:MAG: corC [Caulobacter sp.]|nr:corC [Caulobacter sp.]